jgi:hypothetical protein
LIVAILSQPEDLSKENKFSTAEIPKNGWLHIVKSSSP